MGRGHLGELAFLSYFGWVGIGGLHVESWCPFGVIKGVICFIPILSFHHKNYSFRQSKAGAL